MTETCTILQNLLDKKSTACQNTNVQETLQFVKNREGCTHSSEAGFLHLWGKETVKIWRKPDFYNFHRSGKTGRCSGICTGCCNGCTSEKEGICCGGTNRSWNYFRIDVPAHHIGKSRAAYCHAAEWLRNVRVCLWPVYAQCQSHLDDAQY